MMAGTVNRNNPSVTTTRTVTITTTTNTVTAAVTRQNAAGTVWTVTMTTMMLDRREIVDGVESPTGRLSSLFSFLLKNSARLLSSYSQYM